MQETSSDRFPWLQTKTAMTNFTAKASQKSYKAFFFQQKEQSADVVLVLHIFLS